MSIYVDKKFILDLFERNDFRTKSLVSSIINTCKDDFMNLLLSVLFKIPVVNRYYGLKKSPTILKHVIKLIFCLEIELDFEGS